MRRLKRERLKSAARANALISRPNQEWVLDFASDAISNGRALRPNWFVNLADAKEDRKLA